MLCRLLVYGAVATVISSITLLPSSRPNKKSGCPTRTEIPSDLPWRTYQVMSTPIIFASSRFRHLRHTSQHITSSSSGKCAAITVILSHWQVSKSRWKKLGWLSKCLLVGVATHFPIAHAPPVLPRLNGTWPSVKSFWKSVAIYNRNYMLVSICQHSFATTYNLGNVEHFVEWQSL